MQSLLVSLLFHLYDKRVSSAFIYLRANGFITASPLTRWFLLSVCTGCGTPPVLFTISWLWPQSEAPILHTGWKKEAKTCMYLKTQAHSDTKTREYQDPSGGGDLLSLFKMLMVFLSHMHTFAAAGCGVAMIPGPLAHCHDFHLVAQILAILLSSTTPMNISAFTLQHLYMTLFAQQYFERGEKPNLVLASLAAWRKIPS